MKELQTINCLVCGKPAKSYTGHVHRGKTTVIAGWCEQHPQGSRKFLYRQFLTVKDATVSIKKLTG